MNAPDCPLHSTGCDEALEEMGNVILEQFKSKEHGDNEQDIDKFSFLNYDLETLSQEEKLEMVTFMGQIMSK